MTMSVPLKCPKCEGAPAEEPRPEMQGILTLHNASTSLLCSHAHLTSCVRQADDTMW